MPGRRSRSAENDPGILANAAFVLAYFGEDIGAMIGLVDRALALNPSFARGWYLSGLLRLWAGQPDLAIEHVETSLRLSPRERMGAPLSVMGMAYFFKRQFDEAAAKLLLAIQDHPGSPAAYRVLAACYAHMGRLDEARAIVARLRAITPRGRAERSAFAQPRGPRALPVGPAPGGGRGDMSQTRRLAAILAADVAGYSRLMGADEEGTLERLKALRRELLDPKIAEHHGRIVKTTGDGLLVEFASVVDAVRCAVAVQQAMPERNTGVAADSRIELRIGINLGDVIVEGDDLYGDGVNIAARIEALADAGGVFVSNTVHDHVRDRLPFVFEDLGEQQVKNIARPVRVYRVRDAGAAATSPARRPALPLPDKPSIAVLPFANMSGDPEQEYFADGMVEEIITALSRIRWLFVIARNSSFTYKGQAVDVKQVGRELGVRYVLEGSVRKAGDRVRITAQLIDAATGAHLWADRFDGSLEDVFELQDKVASSVAGVIEPALQAAETAGRPARPTDRSHRLRPLSARAMRSFLSVGRERDARGARSAGAGDRARSALRARRSPGRRSAVSRLVSDGWSEDRRGRPPQGVDFARRALEVAERRPGHPCQRRLCAGVFRRGHRRHDRRWSTVRSRSTRASRAAGLSAASQALGRPTRSAIEHVETALRLSPRDRSRHSASDVIGVAHFFSRPLRRSSAEAAARDPGRSELSDRHTALSPPATPIWGGSTKRARCVDAAARHHPSSSMPERHCLPQPRAPRAVPVGPAPGGGRGDMSQTRRLAAILAADVAGYSRLMGADEEGTLERLKALRRELLDPKIAEHQGRIVKTTGDGLLVEFASVVDAVRCAVAVQQAMPERNTGVAADSRIELRIGINLGDVIVEGDDLYGDGVNIAARIEALADAGGVFVSNTVHDHVRDRLPFVFEDLGEQQVKNIARPVRVYRVRDARPPEPSAPAPPALPLPDKPSIAVLPFANMSGDPEQEYFADGMVEEIITALSPHPLALRHRPQFELHLQGPSRRCEAGRARARRPLCARRLGAQGRRPRAHHRAADRRR